MTRALLPPLITFVVVILGLQAATKLLHVPEWLLPPPSRVAASLINDRTELSEAVLRTGLSAVEGFAISAVTGFAIAVLLSSNRWIHRALYPYAIFFQTVPIIAIAPLLVIWFGQGPPTVIASAAIVSVFPVIANTLTGLTSTDPALLDLFRLYGGGWFATLTKLRIPAALPTVMTGMEIAAGLAVIGAIVGEFIGGGGLGRVVGIAIRQQRTDKVFATVFFATLLGAGLVGVVTLLRRLVLRRWTAIP